MTSALCWNHARRGFYELADIAAKARRGSAAAVSPNALEAVKRIDAIFAIEREINNLSPEKRVEARQETSEPLVDELAIWLEPSVKRSPARRRWPSPSTTC